uniref:Uncharacterized protein n=1 Tax=Plectus sambesii TaxID=2011161 RepID=A0A914WY52_9BILA
MKSTILIVCLLLNAALSFAADFSQDGDLNCARSLLPWATDNLTGAQVHIDVIANHHKEVFTCAEGQKMIDKDGQEVDIPFELTCTDGVFTSNGPPVSADFVYLQCVDL